MVLSVFGDESSDETCQRVFAISGVLGNQIEWEITEKRWLDRTKGVVFHAADCEKLGDLELYKDLTQILATSPVAGISVALDLVAFRQVFPSALPDTAYYQCFSKVISAHAVTAREWNEHVALDPECGEPMVELEFTFDHRRSSEGNAGTLYSAFINQPQWRNSSILSGKVSFDCRTNPRIQMADLVAREAMKDLDRRVGPTKFPRRKSYVALAEGNHFRFLDLDMEYCELLKAETERLAHAEGYAKWLQDTGRVQNGRPHDNYGNRFQYFAWLNNRLKDEDDEEH